MTRLWGTWVAHRKVKDVDYGILMHMDPLSLFGDHCRVWGQHIPEIPKLPAVGGY